MRIERNISQIRAEVLLNYLYPELETEWMVLGKGTFYRNYSQDVLDLNPEERKVTLSRDGFLRLLPEGLLTKNEDLMGEDVAEKYKELEWRRELLNEAFSPFDTYVLHKKLTIERHTSELLSQKLEYILKTYFDLDITSETSELVKEAAVILPFVRRTRGDFGFVASLLEVLMDCDVEMSIGRYSHVDTTMFWMPRVKYDLLIPGLTKEGYREQTERLRPLTTFLREWFIPFEVRLEVNVREHLDGALAADKMTLDYNTELKYCRTEEMEETEELRYGSIE